MKRNNKIEATVRQKLFELQDTGYRSFTAKIIPTLDIDNIIGIRTPILRKFAAEFAKSEEAKDFLKILPHKYYEEYNLHGFIIERCKDFDEAIRLTDEFLPYVDNWATCDCVSPKVFKKNLPVLQQKAKEWMTSKHCWTVRYGIEILMNFFLDKDFDKTFPKLVAKVKSDEYYVKMMVAWYFATALAKQPEDIMPYFEKKILEPWTHNKAIQKSIESYRIPDETKTYLRTLKISSAVQS